MSRRTRKTRQTQEAVSVDTCRVQLQTGKPVVFVDARRLEDWAATEIKVTGAIRLAFESRPIRLPFPKHNYIVVYCG